MKIVVSPSFDERPKGDLLLVPYWEGGSSASSLAPAHDVLTAVLRSGDFKGKVGDVSIVYPGEGQELRICLLGLGRQAVVTAEVLRRAYAAGVKAARVKKNKIVHLLFPKTDPITVEEALRGVIEGVLLSNYAFTELKGDSLIDSPVVLFEQLTLFGLDKKHQKTIDSLQTIAAAVYRARTWVNRNADDANPTQLAEEALRLKTKGLEVTLIDQKRLEKEGMGLLLAVGRGSRHAPCMIQASYRGDPKSKEHILLVGKGVTYDTGGLCLKTPEGMLSMKCDMAGSAVVFAAVQLAEQLKLKINVSALMPLTENAIGSGSYKQGDVYRACNGKTVEILNTDAEGRLILADAIAYGVKRLSPSAIIDVGTLTGAMVITLGEEMAGFFSNDETLSKELSAASIETGEALWRLPLYDYKEALASDIADLANVGGRDASSMKAALFLQEFTDSVPWVHIDMAGPAYISKPKHYHPTKGTGWGVRLLIQFLKHRSRS
ncbi:MAG: leucyl aminopeptidase [Chlamydiia bacterium]|nr:leucyl aminopeptidase [Chlamydiia bacterium]